MSFRKMWRQEIRDEHLFHSASFEDRRDRQRKDERNKGDLTLGGVRFNLIFWIKFSTSVEAIELRRMAPIPEVGVCPSTYFYGLRYSWAGGRGKKEKKRTRRDPRIQEKHLVGPIQSWLIAEAKPRSGDWEYRKGRQHQRMLEYPAAVPRHQHREG